MKLQPAKQTINSQDMGGHKGDPFLNRKLSMQKGMETVATTAN